MKEELVSFETAKLLKEKGFSKTSGFMGWVDKFYHPRTGSILCMGRTGKCKFSGLYYAPTQSLAQKWLREKHEIYLSVVSTNKTAHRYFFNEDCDSIYPIWYKSYEEALEEGLKEGLKLIE